MPSGYPVETADLLADLQRVADAVGRAPTTGEYSEHGEYSPMTVIKRFGGWQDALDEIDAPVDHEPRRGTTPGIAHLDPEDVGLSPLGERRQ